MEFLCCLFPVFLCAPLLVDSLRAVRATLRVECLRAFWATVVLGIPPALLAMLAVDAGRVPSPPWLLVPLDWLAAALCLGASGVWLGTRFVLSSEADAHADYQGRLIDAGASDTIRI